MALKRGHEEDEDAFLALGGLDEAWNCSTQHQGIKHFQFYLNLLLLQKKNNFILDRGRLRHLFTFYTNNLQLVRDLSLNVPRLSVPRRKEIQQPHSWASTHVKQRSLTCTTKLHRHDIRPTNQTTVRACSWSLPVPSIMPPISDPLRSAPPRTSLARNKPARNAWRAAAPFAENAKCQARHVQLRLKARKQRPLWLMLPLWSSAKYTGCEPHNPS